MIIPVGELSGHTDRGESITAAVSAHLLILNVIYNDTLVWHVSWSPAAPIIASCSSDKSIRLYSFAPAPSSSSTAASPSYRFAHKSTIPTSHTKTVRSLAFNPLGTTLATASFDATVGIWQQVDEAGLEDGEGAGGEGGEWEAVDPLEGHDSECKSAEWSSDGRLLATCSRDKSVWVWEAIGPSEFECLAVLMEHTQDVKAVTWHPTEELLASASYDDTIKLFMADDYDDEWTCIHTLTSHTATVWSVCFSPCGNYLASAGDDLVIKIWGRNRQGGPEIGEDGEAKREEGGRMGPWSRGGVRIGAKEKWKWTLKAEIKDAHLRTIYSIDWAVGGLSVENGGIGRIISGGGDGTINIFQMHKPSVDAAIPGAPTFTLVDSIAAAHGVSDVNHVSWCKLDPGKAAATLRREEGGEECDEDTMDVEESKLESDSRWEGCRDMFASAGDDSLVRIWRVGISP